MSPTTTVESPKTKSRSSYRRGTNRKSDAPREAKPEQPAVSMESSDSFEGSDTSLVLEEKSASYDISRATATIDAGLEDSTAEMVSPQDDDVKPERMERSHWQIVLLVVSHIEPGRYQPRILFDETEMQELTASIRLHGVQQPVLVRTVKSSPENEEANSTGVAAVKLKYLRFELVTGERRVRASKLAGLKFIPAIIRDDLTDLQAAELAIFENVQRSNLTVIEEAKGYKSLMIEFRLTETRIAKKVGKSVQTIKDTIKLLTLPEPVQDMLFQRTLTAAHGRELMPLVKYPAVLELVAERVLRDNLTALSLQSTPLPNSDALRARKMIIPLDGRTRFDWRAECGKCPHKAFISSGYEHFCLKPDEWQKKQTTAIALAEQEAARVLEEAKSSASSVVEATNLAPGSYRNLDNFTPPAGCSPQCKCRGEMVENADPTRKVPICLNIPHFEELRTAEREARETAYRHHMQMRWNSAMQLLRSDQVKDTISDDDIQLPSISSAVAALLALPIIRGDHLGYRHSEDWDTMARQAAEMARFDLPFDVLLDEDANLASCLALLQAADATELLAYAACLWLAGEAMLALSYSESGTPYLDAVLGENNIRQGELPETVEPDSLDGTNKGSDSWRAEENTSTDFHGENTDSPANIEAETDGGASSEWPNDSPDDADDTDEDEMDGSDGDLMDEILRNHGEGSAAEVETDEPYLADLI